MQEWTIYKKEFKAYLLLELSLSKHTIEAYLRDISKLEAYLQLQHISLTPSRIETHHISTFLQWLNQLGLGVRSQARLLSSLKAFYKYLCIVNICSEDPTQLIDGPKISPHIPEVLSYDEIQQLLNGVDLSHPQGHRDRAILETLYACGLRVSELTALKQSNLYLDIGFIKVIGKGNKERIVPIGDSAIHYIEIYREQIRRKQTNIDKGATDVLFLNRRGKALSRVMIFNIVKKAAQVAGISKTVSPHTFRHSFATHLIEGGADLKAVQDMLGHASIITTEIYTHLDTDYLRSTIMQFHPLNQKKS
jgi:integrase/recombinase XerD